jgi:hypothetical protein
MTASLSQRPFEPDYFVLVSKVWTKTADVLGVYDNRVDAVLAGEAYVSTNGDRFTYEITRVKMNTVYESKLNPVQAWKQVFKEYGCANDE